MKRNLEVRHWIGVFVDRVWPILQHGNTFQTGRGGSGFAIQISIKWVELDKFGKLLCENMDAAKRRSLEVVEGIEHVYSLCTLCNVCITKCTSSPILGLLTFYSAVSATMFK